MSPAPRFHVRIRRRNLSTIQDLTQILNSRPQVRPPTELHKPDFQRCRATRSSTALSLAKKSSMEAPNASNLGSPLREPVGSEAGCSLGVSELPNGCLVLQHHVLRNRRGIVAKSPSLSDALATSCIHLRQFFLAPNPHVPRHRLGPIHSHFGRVGHRFGPIVELHPHPTCSSKPMQPCAQQPCGLQPSDDLLLVRLVCSLTAMQHHRGLNQYLFFQIDFFYQA